MNRQTAGSYPRDRQARAWASHAAMNFGALLSCAWHGILPPQWTGHDSETIARLAAMGAFAAFLEGLRE